MMKTMERQTGRTPIQNLGHLGTIPLANGAADSLGPRRKLSKRAVAQ